MPAALSPLLLALLLLLTGPSASPVVLSASAPVRPEEGEILRLYRAVLGRAPDDGGFGYWVARRIEGVPLEAVAAEFLVSREFGLRFTAESDRDFVDLVYTNVLGRKGDEPGVEHWLSALDRGLARRHLVLLFAESQEFRTLTGTDLAALPAFRADVSAVSSDDLGRSWRPGCPVGPEQLRSVRLDHIDAEGRHRRGDLIVHTDAVDDVVAVFRRLYEARFPIARMEPIAEFDGDDDASMAANNTSAFNCRAVTGGRRWSRHAYGTAVDLNPIQNPYVADRVLPPEGAPFVDRDRYHPAMVRPGDSVTGAFTDAGWRWGGDFVTIDDFQHFELN